MSANSPPTDKSGAATPCGCPESTGGPFGSPGPVCISLNNPGCRKRALLELLATPSAASPIKAVTVTAPDGSPVAAPCAISGCQYTAASSERATVPSTTLARLEAIRASWDSDIGITRVEWDELCNLALKGLAASATLAHKPCPYCTSDNEAIRTTYYDQTCEGCVKRMGKP